MDEVCLSEVPRY